MKVNDEIYNGIAGLIERGIQDAIAIILTKDTYDPNLPKGIAQSIAAQICQNLEAMNG